MGKQAETSLPWGSHPRSFWLIPLLRELVDWVQITASERLLPAVKDKLEA